MQDEQSPQPQEEEPVEEQKAEPMEEQKAERRLSLAEIRELYFQGKMDRDDYFAQERQIVPSFGYLAMQPEERLRARLEAAEFKRQQRTQDNQ